MLANKPLLSPRLFSISLEIKNLNCAGRSSTAISSISDNSINLRSKLASLPAILILLLTLKVIAPELPVLLLTVIILPPLKKFTVSALTVILPPSNSFSVRASTIEALDMLMSLVLNTISPAAPIPVVSALVEINENSSKEIEGAVIFICPPLPTPLSPT